MKTKPRELGFIRIDGTLQRRPRLRRRRVRDERGQQFPDAEIVDGRTEKHRRLLRREIALQIELRAGAAHQFHLLEKLPGIQSPRNSRASSLAMPAMVSCVPTRPFSTGNVHVDLVFDQVIDAEQIAAHADRPGDRRALNLQHAFDLVQQFDRRPAVAIQFVDESHDGRVAQAAHFHEFDGALFDAFGAVDDHQRGVHRRQSAVGVLGEILVARRIQQIDDAIIEWELHHRGGHRDAALLLQAHPIGGRVTRRLAALDGAGHLDGAAEQQQFFGQRGFAGVGVGDDGKSSSSADFLG